MNQNPVPGGSGRRVILTRQVRAVVSGRMTALILAACFLLAAALIPFAERMPRWIEIELVLAGWWMVWAVTLTALLYRGCDVADDHSGPELRNASSFWQYGRGCLDVMGVVPDEGCGVSLALLVVIPLVVLGIWVAVELLIPAIGFAAYFTIRGMLAWAVNDRNDCEGRWGRAIAWGIFSATLFTGPLALLIWFVHAVRV